MKTLIAAILIGLFAVAAVGEEPLSIGTNQNGCDYIIDRFIVTIQPGTEALMTNQTVDGAAVTGNTGIDLLCENYSVTKVEPFYPRPVRKEKLRSLVERMYVFKLTPDVDAQDVVDVFLTDKDIEYSDLWTIPRLCYVPNDPAIPQQWALSKIEAFGAWDVIRGDTTENVIIGIDDTGVYYNHPDLQANMWINGPEDINGNGIFDSGDINGQDEDGNGYPDDVVGWDFGFNDPDPQENSPTHGTHVAGCASEVADNNIGGAGPGFSAKIMALKITNAQGYLVHGYSAMIYAVDNGVHIINCSWGSNQYNPSYQNICNYVHSEGVLIVAAAGNDDYWPPPYNGYPAAYNNVLAVAATDQNDHKSSYSNYNPWVDLSAPGDNIYSTWGSGSYSSLYGTSMSSPIVAGVAALAKAQDLTRTPDQILNILMSSADDIDSLNPGYEGMLGAGRVNAQGAVSMNSPIIHLIDYQFTITDGDGDNVLNPGESIDLGVEMENVNIDAFNVVATLRAPDGITVSDSVADFGDIPGGEQQDNYSDPFSLTFGADLIPDEFQLIVNVTADGGYNVDLSLTIEISLLLPDFPISLPDAIESDPLICDLDGNGTFEIVIGCNDARLYVIELDGSYFPGWPASVADDINSAPAVGDLDNDGDYEVVAVAKNGEISAWDYSGNILSGFPIVTGGSVFASPTLADIDGNGDLEIIQPNYSTRNIDVFNHDGSAYGDWPYSGTLGWYGAVAVGDIDGDDEIEVVAGGFDSHLHVFNADKTEIPGFPIELDDRVWASPVIGNIDPTDPEPEIVVATQSGSVYLYNHDGSLVAGWPIDVGTAVKSSPSLGDLDDDGTPEIVFGASDANIYVYDSDGSSFDGFPVSLLSNISNSAVIADLTGNGIPDIIIANGSAETFLFAFDVDGQDLPNCPIPTSASGSVKASPAVWDIDLDGDLDIVVGVQNSNNNLDVFDYKYSSSLVGAHWPVFGKDKHRSNNFEAFDPVSIDDEIQLLPLEFGLMQNYPNPFNDHTIIQFSLDVASSYSLDVYDILGRQVKNLDSGLGQAGIYDVTWNGRNDSNNDAASGVYFYRLKTGDKTAVKRMLYLR